MFLWKFSIYIIKLQKKIDFKTRSIQSIPTSWACLIMGYQKLTGESYQAQSFCAFKIFDCGAKTHLVSIKFHSPLNFWRNLNVIIIDTFGKKFALTQRIHLNTHLKLQSPQLQHSPQKWKGIIFLAFSTQIQMKKGIFNRGKTHEERDYVFLFMIVSQWQIKYQVGAGQWINTWSKPVTRCPNSIICSWL